MFNIANCCFSQDLYSETEAVPFGNFAFILRCIGLGCAGLSSGIGASGNLGISGFFGVGFWVIISVSHKLTSCLTILKFVILYSMSRNNIPVLLHFTLHLSKFTLTVT